MGGTCSLPNREGWGGSLINYFALNYILNAYALQDIGHRTNQEDSFYPPFIDPCHCDETTRERSFYDGTPHTDERLFIVCDGMGGHDRGEVASRLVTQTMSRVLLESSSIEGTFDDELVRQAVDEALRELAAHDDPTEVRKMGTTMTMLKFHANGATVAHIGDSRVYHFRPAMPSQPAQMLFRTKDHTMVNDLVDLGQITYAQAQNAPNKHILSRSMTSVRDYNPEVDIAHISDIRPGDVFLLCTDGVFEQMDDDALCTLLTDPNYSDVERAQQVLHECLDNHDNHTAIIVRVMDVLNTTEKSGTDASLAPGTVLQSKNYTYHIEKVLGHGAFGITYLVNTNVSMQGQLGTIHTGVKVALKEFYMHDGMKREGGALIEVNADDDRIRTYADKFRREASKLAMLSHPNIVRVLEVFEANNTIYYSMEYLSGGSLNDYVNRRGGLPEKEAIACIRQIGSALMYLHKNKMLHLDVKPANVMRTEFSDTLKLIDFGLSKRYDPNGDPESSSNLGVGTSGYAPLEQAERKNEHEFAPELDVYALGATYYKLLTAHVPASAIQILNNGLNTLPLVRKKVSQNSIDAIKAAMEPLQAKRLKSVEAFLNMLPRVDDESVFSPQHSHGFWRWVMLAAILASLAIGFGMGLLHEEEVVATRTLSDGGDAPASEFDIPMVRVDGGTFTMGCDDAADPEVDPDEHPLRTVTVSSFYMAKYEVTQAQWRAVMEKGQTHRSKNDNYPVFNKSWDEIHTFIKRLNKKTGRHFRLPTEAEWEYAARGGRMADGNRYSGTSQLAEVAWFADNSGHRLHPVGGLRPNELGIYDMSGNVWEFCSDWYGPYTGDSLANPTGSKTGDYHVIRGGSWNCSPYSCRVTCRQDNSLQSVSSDIGFRLVETR